MQVNSEQISWLDTTILMPNVSSSYLEGYQLQEQPRPRKIRRVTLVDSTVHHTLGRTAPGSTSTTTMISISSSRIPKSPNINQSRNVEPEQNNLCASKDVATTSLSREWRSMAPMRRRASDTGSQATMTSGTGS